MAGYVRYRDFSTGDWLYVYYLSSDDKYAYFISPECYLWAKKLGIEDIAAIIIPSKIDKNYFMHEAIHESRMRVNAIEEKVYIDPSEYPNLREISYFFEIARRFGRYDKLERLNIAIKLTKQTLAGETRDKLIDYIVNELSDDPKYKLRLLFELER